MPSRRRRRFCSKQSSRDSLIQTSPGCGIIVEPLILRGIAVQEGAVVTCGHAAVGGRRRNNFKLLAALVNPGSQSNEILDGEFFHRLLNFLDVAHVPSPTKDSTPLHGSTLRVFEPSPAITGESRHDISDFRWPSFRVLSFTRRRPFPPRHRGTA